MGFCMFQRKFHIQHVGHIFHVCCLNHIFQHLFGNSISKSRTYHWGCNFHNYNGNGVQDDMIVVLMQMSCLYLWIYANHKKILNSTLENIHDKLNQKNQYMRRTNVVVSCCLKMLMMLIKVDIGEVYIRWNRCGCHFDNSRRLKVFLNKIMVQELLGFKRCNCCNQ
jgi:hypothetical protein